MESRARYLFVGISLLSLIVVGALALFWLARSRQVADPTKYIVYFKTHSMSGLEEGSVVTMKGVRVGSVSNFDFSSADIEKIRVVVQLKPGTPVRTDTQAVIATNLLTGAAGVDLVKGSQRAVPLTDVPDGEQYPVISEGAAGLEGLKNSVPEVLSLSRDALERFAGFLSPENQKEVEGIILDARGIVSRLATTDNDPAQVLEELRQLVIDGKAAVREFKTSTTESSKALATVADVVAQQTRVLSDRLARAANSVTLTAEKYRDPTQFLQGPPPSAFGPGERQEEK